VSKLNLDDTICAISTPIAEGGIGIVRLSGPEAIKIAQGIFKSPKTGNLNKVKTHTIHYGHIADNKKNIDEVLLSVMRAPRTYTREDVVEINTHSGIAVLKEVLDLVIARGGRLAEPGEFTRRAFLNNRIDLAQAEAVLDIINSKTRVSLSTALSQLEGVLSKHIKTLREELLGILAEMESRIDFSEDDIDYQDDKKIIIQLEVIDKKINQLLENADDGIILREGILCTIYGRPNVGKSSLFNALLKIDRAIVTETPGTTRDTIEEYLNIQGIPVRITDTAGIDKVDDDIGQAGVQRSREAVKKADLALVVFDGSSALTEEDRNIIAEVKTASRIAVINKIDLEPKLKKQDLKEYFADNIVEISALQEKNLKTLENKIIKLIWHGKVVSSEGKLVTSSRHQECLLNSRNEIKATLVSLKAKNPPEIVSINLKGAVEALGEITGDTIVEDVLNRIFEQFCIGK